MKNGEEIKNVKTFCTQPKMLNRLQIIEEQLKVCEKALNEFLDNKKRAFPRFYFISTTDLLDILSNGNNPEKVNIHMNKIFQGVEKLTLEEKG